ncbi:MAG: site-2 protease family protein [Chloroflexi bacterium]|nr:site-2 protease family protein [Chloroflexota bacterium]
MSSIRIARIFGIPIGIHISWLLILFLVTASLYQEFDFAYPRWDAPERLVIATLTSLLFFGSVLVHELAHSLVARRQGIPVRGIILFVFGGVSQISRESSRPRDEIVMAAIGPLSSVLLGAGFLGLFLALRSVSEVVAAVAGVLFPINFALGIFNLVPGFPLDGGRVLRASLWGIWRDYGRATRTACRVGQAVGMLMIAAGVLLALFGNMLNGLWIALIGWFLTNAAGASHRQQQARERLRGYYARDFMAPQCPKVSPALTVRQLVEERVLPSGARCFVVEEGGTVYGVVAVEAARRVKRGRWSDTPVRQVMTPVERLPSVSPIDPAERVLEVMSEHSLSDLPVMADGQIVGMVSRDDVLRFVKLREDLGL